MNENINLVEILKDCPPRTPLYSVLHGDIEFFCIDRNNHTFPIKLFSSNSGYYTAVTKEGKYIDICNGECTLFPSKDQRDWSKFKAPWRKKERFDPKTLKPFDKVLVRNWSFQIWTTRLFSRICKDPQYRYDCNGKYKFCVPYNKDTEHLLGKVKEAPEFYRYWED